MVKSIYRGIVPYAFQESYNENHLFFGIDVATKIKDHQNRTYPNFQKAKKKLKARFAESSETVSDIAENIGYYMTVCNDLDLVEKYLEDLENYTLEDANKITDKYLQFKNSVTTVLLPE